MNNESDDRHLSTRVNSARLPGYLEKNVRLACKVLFVDGEQLNVEASDGGQVKVLVPPTMQNEPVTDPYIEVIGRVQDSATLQMLSCINLGSQLDMKLVNDVIELIHDPRFYPKMFV